MNIDFDMLGTRIKKRRRELNLKQNELSEMLGISNNYLSNIENGHSIPSLEVFSDICIKLKITPDLLLLGVIRVDNIPENIKDNLKLLQSVFITSGVEVEENLIRKNSQKR